MIDLIYYILPLTIFFFVVFAIVPHWIEYRKLSIGLGGHDIKHNKSIINKALKELNCQPDWRKEKDVETVFYDYQNQHFCLDLKKDSPIVKLTYPVFYETPLENISVVRFICNRCNSLSETERIYYIVDQDKGIIKVSIVSGLLLTPNTATSLLTRTMNSMFGWQNAYVRYFEDLQNDKRLLNNRDIEKSSADFSRMLYLLREQEIMHQPSDQQQRSNAKKLLTLHHFLSTAMGLSDIIPMQLTVYHEDNTNQLTGNQAILNYPLPNALIADGKFIYNNATLLLTYYNGTSPKEERAISLYLNEEESSKETLYFRITATSVPLSSQPNLPMGSLETQAEANSVLAAYDLLGEREQVFRFRYFWKEAMAKKKAGEENQLTDEERFICDAQEPDLAYNLYQGIALTNQERYLEATVYLDEAYQMLQKDFDNLSETMRDKFYQVCYYLGFCYNDLRQYEKAHFYLQIVFPLRQITYTQEFVNCLVNSKDYRALEIVDSLLGRINFEEHEDDEEGPSIALLKLKSFLLRRKAYLLIDQKKYKEAEEILRPMLTDPDSSDFAINELAYLKKKKGEGNDDHRGPDIKFN